MKTITIPSSISGSTQPLSIFEPANTSTSKHPILLEMQGQGQVGNMSFDGNSVSGQLAAGKSLPAGYADAVIINVHKPQDGNGSAQYQRFKDAYNWVIANYPTADPNRIAICGLSLGGGAVFSAIADIEFCKKLCAIIPCAGTPDINLRTLLAPDLLASGVPFQIYGSTTDDNGYTQSGFWIALDAYSKAPQAVKNNGALIDTKTGHGGTWAKAYSFTGTGSMWDWLSKQSRAGIAPPVIIPPVVVPPVVVATRKLVASKVILGTADRTVKTWQETDGTFTVEVV